MTKPIGQKICRFVGGKGYIPATGLADCSSGFGYVVSQSSVECGGFACAGGAVMSSWKGFTTNGVAIMPRTMCEPPSSHIW